MTNRVQIIVALAIVLLDQIVKAMVRSRLMLHDSITVIPGFFDLTRVHNTGAAYGFLDGVDFPFKTALLACVATAALVGLTVYTAGYVLDFVDLYRGDWHFWAFNVADSAISIGVVLMILELLGLGRTRVSRTV
jgi:signal peptidase II